MLSTKGNELHFEKDKMIKKNILVLNWTIILFN